MSAQPCLPIAALILAAGSATRMGRLKQLLPFRGRTLIEHSIDTAIEAHFQPIVIVVGAEAARVQSAIATKPIEIVYNSKWSSGMGSSISTGISRLLEIHTGLAGVALLLSDQPLVNARHLKDMSSSFHQSDGQVVAASYSETVGVPAIFGRSLFPRLLALPANAGAKALLQDPSIAVVRFSLPAAAIDVDTPDDFAKLG